MTAPGATVWHAGEVALHRALGVEDKMHRRGQMVVRDHMPDQHRQFFETLPFVVLSALDTEGEVWPFLRTGAPGFMQSPLSTRLVIRSRPLPHEPERLLLSEGAKISVLGIELETKRRNRMNGTVAGVQGQSIHIETDQSYGNCPRYIHVREALAPAPAPHSALIETSDISATDRDQIEAADMLFIASRAAKTGPSREAGVDINHRGGQPGFVRVLDKTTLAFPDYDGNNFFNTFGNILQDPRAGLLFVDLLTGDTLTLSGRAEVVMDDPLAQTKFGAGRYLRFQARKVRRATGAFPLRYRLVEPSPNPPAPALG